MLPSWLERRIGFGLSIRMSTLAFLLICSRSLAIYSTSTSNKQQGFLTRRSQLSWSKYITWVKFEATVICRRHAPSSTFERSDSELSWNSIQFWASEQQSSSLLELSATIQDMCHQSCISVCNRRYQYCWRFATSNRDSRPSPFRSQKRSKRPVAQPEYNTTIPLLSQL